MCEQKDSHVRTLRHDSCHGLIHSKFTSSHSVSSVVGLKGKGYRKHVSPLCTPASCHVKTQGSLLHVSLLSAIEQDKWSQLRRRQPLQTLYQLTPGAWTINLCNCEQYIFGPCVLS